MRVWEIDGDYGIDRLRLAGRDEPSPGPGQVVLAMRAASLNFRDLATIRGQAMRHRLPLIPFPEGAGGVAAVGEGVPRFKVGDGVCPMFFQSWLEGHVTAEKRSRALGGPLSGVLQE